MKNLKDLMEKYGSVTGENGLMDGVEVDMDPTVGVVETIINGEEEETVKSAIESASADAEELEETVTDTDELEETIEGEEKEEATTESAIKIMDKINFTLEKHGFKSDEDKETMGYKADTLNTESAQSFPVATRESAVEIGKNVVAKIKEAIKWIIDKIVKTYEFVKDKILALCGNNAATAKKLKGILAGVEDKLAEGKEFKGDYASKFPLAAAINSTSVIASMFTADASRINSVIGAFTAGCSAKDLSKFNSLEGVATDKAAGDLMGADKAILVGINGNKVTALVVKEGSLKLETKDAEGKAPALTAPLSNSDLSKICDAIISGADGSKKVIESTKAGFESLKNVKVEDAEFAKTAKIEANISMLTSAKMKMLDALSKQPKVVLQFVAANIAVKAKKA